MATKKTTIGRTPTFAGDWVNNYVNPKTGHNGYPLKKRVSHLGSEFQSLIEDNTYEPATLNQAHTEITFDTEHWEVVSNGSDAYLLQYTVENKMDEVDARLDEQDEKVEMLNGSDVVVGVLPVSGENNKIYRVPNDPTAGKYTDYGWNGTQFVPLCTYPNDMDDEPTAGSDNMVKSGGVQNELALGAVYDVSAKNPTAGPNNDGKFESLSALLSDANLSTLIPSSVRKGGMSVKFIQSSDNKYVQYRLMADEFTTDTAQWAITDEGVYVENPEFVYVKTDKDNKILWAIKADGGIYYGAGCPQQVKDYIKEKLAGFSPDEYEDIVTFLSDYLGSDTTLKILLDSKLDAEGLDPDALSTVLAVENSEYIQATTDSDGKLLEGIETNTGKHRFATQSLNDIEESDNYLYAIKDENDAVIACIKKNGQIDYLGDVPQKTKEYIKEFVSSVASDPFEMNRHQEQNVYAASRYFIPRQNKDFQIALVSDSHGNNNSVKRVVEISNRLASVDAVIHLGDIFLWTVNNSNNGDNPNTLNDLINGVLDNSSKPYFLVSGNHDVGMSRYVHYSYTHEEVYNNYIKPMIDRGFLISGEYNTEGDWKDRCYYFHDFVKAKIRMIVLYDYGMELELDDNEYWEPVTYNSGYAKIVPGQTYTYDESNPIVLNCGGWKENSFRLKQTVTPTTNPLNDALLTTGGTWPWYKLRNLQMFEKSQMEWLISTLNSTPDDYGIVVVAHQALMYPVVTTDYKFSIGSNPDNTYTPRNNYIGDDVMIDTPIVSRIVNAWQTKSQLSERVVARDFTYIGQNGSYRNTEHDEQGDYMYKIEFDFSSRTNNNAYFSSFVSGHAHCDIVEKSVDYPRQLNIITTCSSPAIREQDDIPNILDTTSPAYDSITIYSCAKNRIALCKWGGTRTIAGIDRSFEIINPNNN